MTIHRKRRIAADEAHSWARNLRLKNPYAKLVLCMLTLYVNGEGSCFVSAAALAEDCELALETVRRRLSWLEGIGAITKFPQWLDENGRRNGEGRGRRTTDDIRLMMQIDPDEIEAKAHGNGDEDRPETTEQTSEISPLREGGTNSGGTPTSPPVSPLATPSLRRGPDSSNLEPEPKDSPLPPKGGSEAEQPDDQGSEQVSQVGLESWVLFEQAYVEPILRQSIARQVWSALSDDERVLAIKAAKGYVAHRRAQKKPPNVINAHTFLRERDAWPGYAKLAPPEVVPPTFIAEQSQDAVALLVLSIILDEALPPIRFDVERGVPGYWRKYPVTLDLLGLAALADKPLDQWISIGKETKQFFAWAERIENWIGRRPEPRRVNTGGEHPFTHNGQTTMIKNFIVGLRVPCIYPPRKDGSISSTDPPKFSAA